MHDGTHPRETKYHAMVSERLRLNKLMVFGCLPVVQQHQRWTKPEESDVPEFTIEVAYKTADRHGNTVDPGWRWVVKWLENGQPRSAREYGYATKEWALLDAKKAADGIARSLAPVHVETYTPEI